MAIITRYALRPPFTQDILRASGANAELHFLTLEAVADFVNLNKHRINNLDHFEIVKLEYEEPALTVVNSRSAQNVGG